MLSWYLIGVVIPAGSPGSSECAVMVGRCGRSGRQECGHSGTHFTPWPSDLSPCLQGIRGRLRIRSFPPGRPAVTIFTCHADPVRCTARTVLPRRPGGLCRGGLRRCWRVWWWRAWRCSRRSRRFSSGRWWAPWRGAGCPDCSCCRAIARPGSRRRPRLHAARKPPRCCCTISRPSPVPGAGPPTARAASRMPPSAWPANSAVVRRSCCSASRCCNCCASARAGRRWPCSRASATRPTARCRPTSSG